MRGFEFGLWRLCFLFFSICMVCMYVCIRAVLFFFVYLFVCFYKVRGWGERERRGDISISFALSLSRARSLLSLSRALFRARSLSPLPLSFSASFSLSLSYFSLFSLLILSLSGTAVSLHLLLNRPFRIPTFSLLSLILFIKPRGSPKLLPRN